MRYNRRAAVLWLLTPLAFAQTTISLKNQARDVDFSSASLTKPVRLGTVLPGTCSPGELFFKSNASQGSNLYACANGVWSVVGGGSGTVTLAGDVTGTPDASVIASLQGNPVSAATPIDGDVLRWNATLRRWTTSPVSLTMPSMTNNANKLFSTDGTVGSWRVLGPGLATDAMSVYVDYSLVPGLGNSNVFTQPNTFSNVLTVSGGNAAIDASNAHATSPIRVVTVNPGTCGANKEMVINATDGHLYRCNGLGTGWAQVDGGGAAGGGGLGDPGANGLISRSAVNLTAPATAGDVSSVNYATGGGTAQAQTATLSPAVLALVNGLQFCWLPAAANTDAAPTLAVNGLAAQPVTKLGTSPLMANDLTTTAVACVVYDGTEYQLQNPQTITNGGTTVTIASGTASLGVSEIGSGACADVVTVNAAGVAGTDAIAWSPNASLKTVTGYLPAPAGGLSIAAYPAGNSVNFDVCNWTSSPITPGAVTLNWRVTR